MNIEQLKRLANSRYLTISKLLGENADLRSELEQIADVWEAMWRAKHKEARAEWIVPDMLAWVKEKSTEIDDANAELKALHEDLDLREIDGCNEENYLQQQLDAANEELKTLREVVRLLPCDPNGHLDIIPEGHFAMVAIPVGELRKAVELLKAVR